jgi:phosphoserine phosphatase RsbU/P
MSGVPARTWGSPEDFFQDAPCGYVVTTLEGTIVEVNRTFATWVGIDRDVLLAGNRFQDFLSAGGRIYYETHLFPLLQLHGEARGIAMEIVLPDGSLLPALVNSVVGSTPDESSSFIRTTVFDATDRRAYEQELRTARRREHEIAERLQSSLLAGHLPASARIELGVTYRPGVSGLQVGGDWYDAFWLEEPHTVGLVVGDVVGRGLDAATSMGQLRSAVRALALMRLDPGALLEALDRYSAVHDVGEMATLVYAQLDLRSGSLRFACAGHPPPLAVPAGGEPVFLWEGRSMPLNTQLGSGARSEATVTLGDGATLLLYTDGLIDRAAGSSERSMEVLLAEAGSRRGQPPDQQATSIVRALHNPDHRDDVCVLVAQLIAQSD